MLWCNKKVDQELRTLGQDLFFRSVLVVGSAISIGLVIWIICFNHDELTFVCRSSRCFSGILEVFKFPISFATATFFLAGFIAVVFRSQQTAIQIQQAVNQNVFKNYFDHKKDFTSLLDDIEKNFGVYFYNKKSMYFTLFPLNSPNDFNFISKSADSDKSPLEFWVANYNKKVQFINDNSYFVFDKGADSDAAFIDWLREFVSAMAEANILFSLGGCSVSDYLDRKGVFRDLENWNNFPIDLYDGIFKVNSVFEVLLNYCLPKSSSSIKITTITISKEVLNEGLKYVCGNRRVS